MHLVYAPKPNLAIPNQASPNLTWLNLTYILHMCST